MMGISGAGVIFHDFQARLDPSGHKGNRLRDPPEDPQNPRFFSKSGGALRAPNGAAPTLKFHLFPSSPFRPFARIADFFFRGEFPAPGPGPGPGPGP